MKITDLSIKIYDIVKKVPRGNVTTYGKIAELVGNKYLCRVVGSALHNNPSPKTIPCHRVVNASGCLAPKFAFGGKDEQKRRLEKENVKVVLDKVDLKIFAWDGK